jgi:hypothetical protein
MERTIAFIGEQQAQTTVTMDRVSDRLDALTVKIDCNSDGISALLAIAEIQAAEIRELRESTQALANWQQESEERGRRTDERLNALINIVERHISSESRDGKTQA